MEAIKLGARRIGPGHPCFIAAEIGINHNGDLKLAMETIDAAAAAGADAVKFQNYHTEDFISDRSLMYEYVSQGQTVRESQHDMFKRCELSPEALAALKAHCDRRGVIFFSTPTSAAGVADVVRAGAPLLKNGSDYLVHLPLIRVMARTGLPTVISTGMSTLAEIDDAVRAFRAAGGKELILLHCTSSYPAPPEDTHLRKIATLQAAFGCPVGLSDHTWGMVAAVGAVALGACFIEKHVTLDKNLPGPDHRFSADPVELKQMVDAVRTLETSLGRPDIGYTPSEEAGRVGFRLSCVAAEELPAGHILSENDIAFRRPGTGVPPAQAPLLMGRTLLAAVPKGKTLEPADFI